MCWHHTTVVPQRKAAESELLDNVGRLLPAEENQSGTRLNFQQGSGGPPAKVILSLSLVPASVGHAFPLPRHCGALLCLHLVSNMEPKRKKSVWLLFPH